MTIITEDATQIIMMIMELGEMQGEDFMDWGKGRDDANNTVTRGTKTPNR